jgi:hypothetical protein
MNEMTGGQHEHPAGLKSAIILYRLGFNLHI